MPIPPFIVELRKHIGHAPLWLLGATAVVLDDEDRVLLVRRSDTGHWAAISGIVEPGEHRGVLGALGAVDDHPAARHLGDGTYELRRDGAYRRQRRPLHSGGRRPDDA